LLEALKRRELFVWLDLSPQRWWHALLFCDAYNWGGVEAQLGEQLAASLAPGAQELPGLEGLAEDGGGVEPVVRCAGAGWGRGGSVCGGRGLAGALGWHQHWHQRVTCTHSSFLQPSLLPLPPPPHPTPNQRRYQWSLRDFLPEALQQPLVLALTEFVYNPWREARAGRLAGASQGCSQAAKDAWGAEELQVCVWGGRRLLLLLLLLLPPAWGGPGQGQKWQSGVGGLPRL
jgi:DNA polymerase epsilon subunit 1